MLYTYRDELSICDMTKLSGYLYHSLHIHEQFAQGSGRGVGGCSIVDDFDLYGCYNTTLVTACSK